METMMSFRSSFALTKLLVLGILLSSCGQTGGTSSQQPVPAGPATNALPSSPVESIKPVEYEGHDLTELKQSEIERIRWLRSQSDYPQEGFNDPNRFDAEANRAAFIGAYFHRVRDSQYSQIFSLIRDGDLEQIEKFLVDNPNFDINKTYEIKAGEVGDTIFSVAELAVIEGRMDVIDLLEKHGLLLTSDEKSERYFGADLFELAMLTGREDVFKRLFPTDASDDQITYYLKYCAKLGNLDFFRSIVEESHWDPKGQLVRGNGWGGIDQSDILVTIMESYQFDIFDYFIALVKPELSYKRYWDGPTILDIYFSLTCSKFQSRYFFESLLELGPNVNLQFGEGFYLCYSCLMWATDFGGDPWRVKRLLDSGAILNPASAYLGKLGINDYPQHPLAFAIYKEQFEIADMMLAAGADLHFKSQQGEQDILELFRDKGTQNVKNYLSRVTSDGTVKKSEQPEFNDQVQ